MNEFYPLDIYQNITFHFSPLGIVNVAATGAVFVREGLLSSGIGKLTMKVWLGLFVITGWGWLFLWLVRVCLHVYGTSYSEALIISLDRTVYFLKLPGCKPRGSSLFYLGAFSGELKSMLMLCLLPCWHLAVGPIFSTSLACFFWCLLAWFKDTLC